VFKSLIDRKKNTSNSFRNLIFQRLNREKQIKGYSREKKNYLIQKMNPDWRDLSNDIL
jgi:predicted GIY-YIG superfamily endonuclease